MEPLFNIAVLLSFWPNHDTAFRIRDPRGGWVLYIRYIGVAHNPPRAGSAVPIKCHGQDALLKTSAPMYISIFLAMEWSTADTLRQAGCVPDELACLMRCISGGRLQDHEMPSGISVSHSLWRPGTTAQRWSNFPDETRNCEHSC